MTILSCTQQVQPLDHNFMGPLKLYYNEEIRVFLKEANRPITSYDIVELFWKAYMKCQIGEISFNGFKVGDIYPFNRNIFTQADYIAAATDLEEIQNCQNYFNNARLPCDCIFAIEELWWNRAWTIRLKNRNSLPCYSLSNFFGTQQNKKEY